MFRVTDNLLVNAICSKRFIRNRGSRRERVTTTGHSGIFSQCGHSHGSLQSPISWSCDFAAGTISASSSDLSGSGRARSPWWQDLGMCKWDRVLSPLFGCQTESYGVGWGWVGGWLITCKSSLGKSAHRPHGVYPTASRCTVLPINH